MFQKMYGQVAVKTKIIENVCRTFTLLTITKDQDSHHLTELANCSAIVRYLASDSGTVKG
jgi:hypothetical protein